LGTAVAVTPTIVVAAEALSPVLLVMSRTAVTELVATVARRFAEPVVAVWYAVASPASTVALACAYLTDALSPAIVDHRVLPPVNVVVFPMLDVLMDAPTAAEYAWAGCAASGACSNVWVQPLEPVITCAESVAEHELIEPLVGVVFV
jgi:hypothetical protein